VICSDKVLRLRALAGVEASCRHCGHGLTMAIAE
jgi:hypothetical protein